MELWVRSQDRLLLSKADKLLINGPDIFNQDQVIGTYSTYKRALEVLDEIHERIAMLTTMKIMGVNDTNAKIFRKYLEESPCSVVYEMPKD